jgi:hypothetical protein
MKRELSENLPCAKFKQYRDKNDIFNSIHLSAIVPLSLSLSLFFSSFVFIVFLVFIVFNFIVFILRRCADIKDYAYTARTLANKNQGEEVGPDQLAAAQQLKEKAAELIAWTKQDEKGRRGRG